MCMYTKAVFGKELKQRLAEGNNVLEIAAWAYDVYLRYTPEDAELRRILIILNTMGDGSEFEISYERLDEIADDLIAEKTNINMDY